MSSSPPLPYSPLLFCYSAKADIDRRACSVRSRFLCCRPTRLAKATQTNGLPMLQWLVILRDPTHCKPSYSSTPLNANTVDIQCFTWNILGWSNYGMTPARAPNGITVYGRQRILHVKSASRIKIWSNENKDNSRRIAITTTSASFCWRCYTKLFHQSTRNRMYALLLLRHQESSHFNCASKNFERGLSLHLQIIIRSPA